MRGSAGSGRRHEGLEWWRLVGVALALIVAVFSARISTSLYLSQSNPSLAVDWWSANSLGRANLAGREVTNEQRTQALANAAIALRAQPGNATAAWVMAVANAGRGEARRAARWVVYGERQSRRDLGTELTLIEYNVTQGNVRGALLHYDRALRVSPSSDAQLFPILSAAAADPQVVGPLVETLRHRPFWREFFLPQFTSGATPFAVIAPVIRGLHLDPANPKEREILTHAIAKGIADKDFVGARGFVPGAADKGIRDGDFEHAGPWAPFDWALSDDGELGGLVEQGVQPGHGAALFLAARNGRSGEVARQALVLTPGRYRLLMTAGAITGDDASRPVVKLDCATSDQSLMTWTLPALPRGGGQIRNDVVIPPGCSGQWLVITATTPSGGDDDGADTVRPWIDDIAVMRD